MTAFNAAQQAQAQAAFDMVGKRDEGISVGVCFGVAGGLLGGAAAVSKGASMAAGIGGAVAGAAVGYAMGNVFKTAELFGTTGKILNSAVSGLTGASTALAVAELINAFGGGTEI